MSIIQLSTVIKAPIEACFNISLSIDAHLKSAAQTNEKLIDGPISGLCQLGDLVTWQAKHFGITQKLSVVISQLEFPIFFEDKMTKGAFKNMRHEHHFESQDEATVMKDYFEYEVLFGFIGQLFDRLVLKKYLTNFLLKRNQVLKSMLEQAQY